MGLKSFISQTEPPSYSDLPSSRMVKLASRLPMGEYIGWQMLVPQNGLIRYQTFASDSVVKTDLSWIYEELARAKESKRAGDAALNQLGRASWNLYEVGYMVAMDECDALPKQHCIDEHIASRLSADWPMRLEMRFGELVEVLRQEGAAMRFTVGRASDSEMRKLKTKMTACWQNSQLDVNRYIGFPVRTKCLLALPSKPSARLIATIHDVTSGGEMIYIGKVNSVSGIEQLQSPLVKARVLPSLAAQALVVNPFVGEEPILGVKTCPPKAKDIPFSHKNSKDLYALKVGQAMSTAGIVEDITLSQSDLKRHWQIVGQTGTGKSTLLVSAITEAIKSGIGVTFFDPHGTTIDTVLQMISAKDAKRVYVVRVGDVDNPVPMNVWNTEFPEEVERTNSELFELFSEIFNPRDSNYVGPVWERWFYTFASAAINLLGKQASFESLTTLSQNKRHMKMLAEAIQFRDPNLSLVLQHEYVNNRSDESSNLVNWAVSKMQRLTSVNELRQTLGAGANALDFNRFINEENVLLVDLAMPKIGTNAARVLATMTLLKLWTAIMQRQQRDKLHLVAIDEAHLFQNSPLPQMLAEGRKFGLGMILAHQHNAQLASGIREALDANAANFTAFRLSVRDAKDAVVKFDNPHYFSALCRLSAFQALTTLSVDGAQSPAFTLNTIKPKLKRNGLAIAKRISNQSIKSLVHPYRHRSALSRDDINQRLIHYAKNPLPPLLKLTNNVGPHTMTYSAQIPDYIVAIATCKQNEDKKVHAQTYDSAWLRVVDRYKTKKGQDILSIISVDINDSLAPRIIDIFYEEAITRLSERWINNEATFDKESHRHHREVFTHLYAEVEYYQHWIKYVLNNVPD